MHSISDLDLAAIVEALADQTDYEHRWLIDPATGEILFWTSDTGIDGENPIDLDELTHLILIEPLPPVIWYRDMSDFVETLSDQDTGQRLARAIEGKGAFRRFKQELYASHEDLISTWHEFRDARANLRALEWLVEEGIVSEDEADSYRSAHTEPEPG